MLILYTSRCRLFIRSTRFRLLCIFPVSFRFLSIFIFKSKKCLFRPCLFPASWARLSMPIRSCCRMANLILWILHSFFSSPKALSTSSHWSSCTTATRRCRWEWSRLRIQHSHCMIYEVPMSRNRLCEWVRSHLTTPTGWSLLHGRRNATQQNHRWKMQFPNKLAKKSWKKVLSWYIQTGVKVISLCASPVRKADRNELSVCSVSLKSFVETVRQFDGLRSASFRKWGARLPL